MAKEHDEARAADDGSGPVRLKRSDLALLRQAGRQRWNVPDQLRTAAIFEVAMILATAPKRRDKLAAIKALIEFDRTDQRDDRTELARERLELDRNPNPSFDLSQLTEDAEREAASYRPDERPGTPDEPPGPLP